MGSVFTAVCWSYCFNCKPEYKVYTKCVLLPVDLLVGINKEDINTKIPEHVVKKSVASKLAYAT